MRKTLLGANVRRGAAMANPDWKGKEPELFDAMISLTLKLDHEAIDQIW